MNTENQHLNWIQRRWRDIKNLYHQLKPSRFSILVALIACPVLLCVAQGTEILRTVGEGMAGGQWYWPRVFGFFAALILWAISSWYAARVLLYLVFPGDDPDRPRWEFAQIHVPRLLGVAPILIVGCGFWVASKSYSPTEKTRSWLLGFAFFCLVLAIVLYALLFYRRRIFNLGSETPGQRMNKFGRSTKIGVGIITLISLVLFVAFTIAPVLVAQNIGMGTILLLAASSWVGIGGLFVYLGGRWQFPLISVFISLALLFSLWNDNHFIRTVPPRQGDRASVIASFEAWHTLVTTNFPDVPVHPLYIVATEGGGIRAAYWTGIVLGGLQDTNPNFATHLFAISGVSGGSLGAAVFDALVAEPNAGDFQENAHKILSQDFLSPALAAMLYPDLVQRFLPVPIYYFDRARALEAGWEKAWRDTMGNDRFANSFVDLWPAGSQKWVPALFLNGTSVEKGNRIITSNLRVTDSFFDADDAAMKLRPPNTDATKAECNIPLSTAAHMSARFTYVSPAGRFPDGSHIVDGGYFENSAATTALEIVTRINEWCAFKNIHDVDVKVIMISNDPRRPPVAPSKPGPKQKVPPLTQPETVRGHFMGEIMAPLSTLLNARNARGTFAQRAIGYQQRRFKAGATEPPSRDDPQSMTPDIFYFTLEDQDVALPLGWMLSAAAADSMRKQWNMPDSDVVKNKTATEAIVGTLPPASPH